MHYFENIKKTCNEMVKESCMFASLPITPYIYINISYISISNGAGFLYVSLNSMNLMTGPLLPFKYAAFLEKMKSFLKELGFEKCSSC